MKKHWSDVLVGMGACPDAVEWCRGYPTIEAAWAACQKSIWMLWWIGCTTSSEPWSAKRTPVVRVAIDRAIKDIHDVNVAFAAGVATSADVRAKCADIVRKYFPRPPAI